MKRLLLAFMLILPLIGSAKIPDEEDIRRKIFDPTSKFYYINLMMRYNNLERLNDDEYHYLYYGFAFQENYKPTASNPSAISNRASKRSVPILAFDRSTVTLISSKDMLSISALGPRTVKDS